MALKKVGVSEDRTSGLQLTAEEIRATTAAPGHRFDGENAICLDYDFHHFLCLFEGQMFGEIACLHCVYVNVHHPNNLVKKHVILATYAQSEAIRSSHRRLLHITVHIESLGAGLLEGQT
jgi:hypothetical protein